MINLFYSTNSINSTDRKVFPALTLYNQSAFIKCRECAHRSMPRDNTNLCSEQKMQIFKSWRLHRTKVEKKRNHQTRTCFLFEHEAEAIVLDRNCHPSETAKATAVLTGHVVSRFLNECILTFNVRSIARKTKGSNV